MSTVTSLTFWSESYCSEPLTNAVLSGEWRKISIRWGKVEVDYR